MKNKRWVIYIIILAAICGLLMFPAATPTYADDPTATPTETSTPTPTSTPTATPTVTPTAGPGAILWAEGAVVDGDVRDAIEDLLVIDPPTTDSYVYAITDVYETSDTTWLVSVIALDIEGDIDDWNVMEHGLWMGGVLVTDSLGSYNAEYYEPDLGVTGGPSVPSFPWSSGYKAYYGILGVHPAGFGESMQAVDLVGGLNLTNSMPPQVYGAADGIVNWVCTDDFSMGVKASGPLGEFLYLHLEINSSMTTGTRIYTRRVFGDLVMGSFCTAEMKAADPDADCHCGYASQASNNYHIHFGFEPVDDKFQIQNCVLDVTTEIFTCGTETYEVGEWLPNGGGSYDDPADPEDPTVPVAGGGHIWDGFISAIYQVAEDIIMPLLPEGEQQPLMEGLFRVVVVGFRIFIIFSQIAFDVPSAALLATLIGFIVVMEFFLMTLWIIAQGVGMIIRFFK